MWVKGCCACGKDHDEVQREKGFFVCPTTGRRVDYFEVPDDKEKSGEIPTHHTRKVYITPAGPDDTMKVTCCSECGLDHETVDFCDIWDDGVKVKGEHYWCPVSKEPARIYQGRRIDEFEHAYENAVQETNHNVTKLVIAVKLPTGATELIINTEQIKEKVNYYLTAYDQDLRLKTNPEIQIVGYMFA